MHKVYIYSISKKDEKCYEQIATELIKNCKKFAKIEIVNIFNKKINKAQKELDARNSYEEALRGYLLKDGLNIALHPEGEMLDSFEFAKILKNNKVAFFIGGAYGFNVSFLNSCDRKISLSPLTMSHKIAKIVLLEQIFRGFSIINNHPYHK
jgi:23S rRNA (pseudouridine1915-N3)-methyltransferase